VKKKTVFSFDPFPARKRGFLPRIKKIKRLCGGDL